VLTTGPGRGDFKGPALISGSGGSDMARDGDFYLDESTMQGIRECLDKGNTPVRVSDVDLGDDPVSIKPYLYD
jgi:hypothetical protein